MTGRGTPARMTLAGEYFRERAREEWQIHECFKEEGAERTAMSPSAEWENRLDALLHALRNWASYRLATLFPKRWCRLVETTKCGDAYRSWEYDG